MSKYELNDLVVNKLFKDEPIIGKVKKIFSLDLSKPFDTESELQVAVRSGDDSNYGYSVEWMYNDKTNSWAEHELMPFDYRAFQKCINPNI